MLLKNNSLGVPILIAYEVTDEDGLICFEGVLTGVEYTVMEYMSPDGYTLAEPVTFTIPDDTVANDEGRVITITMTDKKLTTTITTTTTTTSVKTGDDMPIGFALALIMISFIMMAAESVAFVRKFKK